MITLPVKFEAHKSTFKMLRRKIDLALYQRTSKMGGVEYEVVKIRVRAAQEINGYMYPEQEQYPSASQWGIYGWTFMDIKKAEQKYFETA